METHRCNPIDYKRIDAMDCDLAYGMSIHNPAMLPRIAVLHKSWNDGGDEPSFAWVVTLDDGSWMAITGSHDCTGWDCQSGIDMYPAESLESAIALCGDDPRRAWSD